MKRALAVIGALLVLAGYTVSRGYYVRVKGPGWHKIERREGWRAVSELPGILLGPGSGTSFRGLAAVTKPVGLTSIAFPSNLEFLGSATCDVDAANCGVLDLTAGGRTGARDYLMIVVKVVGYSGGGDIESLRFNSDSGSTYWWRGLKAAAGAATFANVQSVTSATLCQLADVAITGGRVSTAFVTNRAAQSKRVQWMTGDVTGAVGTPGNIILGGCEWVNTTAQITSVQLLAAAGANLLADTEIGVFGHDL